MSPDRPVVWLVRHGETEWNLGKRIQGAMDVPLSEAGRLQARALAARLTEAPPARIVSSDLVRARETAEIVAAATGHGVETDPRLREQSLGTWEGLTFAQVIERFPDLAARFAAREPGLRPPGGESRADLQARAWAALEHHARPGASGPLLLVSHGGAVQALLYRVLGLPLDAPRRFLLPNAGLSVIQSRRGVWYARTLCDVSHLPSAPNDTFPFE